MLEEKIRELDTLEAKYNDLRNQKKLGDLKSEEELNRLRMLMDRTSHEL